MERNIQVPLTLPKHPKLLHEINEMKIAMTAWYDSEIDEAAKKELQKRYSQPSWPEVESLLRRCYNAINEQREDPRKY